LMRTYLYFDFVVIRGCWTKGWGFERVIAAIMESLSSSESIGPLFSISSCRGALASIAASVE
jgi:hypothetical protein